MTVTDYYSAEDLKKLPLRAIVALAARCARRVENLALLPADAAETERCRTTVGSAIRLAEHFAHGLPCSSLESAVEDIDAWRADAQGDFVRDNATGAAAMAARAAAAAIRALSLRGESEESRVAGVAKADPVSHLADITADQAAQGAFMAAANAVAADGHSDAFMSAAADDYQKVLRLDLGHYPQAGAPIDPSAHGPLGSWEPKS